MRDLGIEFISVFGLPPVDFVHLAADLGCRYVSTGLASAPLKALGYPAFSLKTDVRLRRQVLAAMRDRGVSISLGEGMVIVPHADVSDLAPDLDVMAELGAAQINTLSFERDRNRTFDQLATLTAMAAERGIGTTVELAPGDGELPLAEMLGALPAYVVVGLEIPMRSLAESGVGPMERLRPCVAAARELVDS